MARVVGLDGSPAAGRRSGFLACTGCARAVKKTEGRLTRKLWVPATGEDSCIEGVDELSDKLNDGVMK